MDELKWPNFTAVAFDFDGTIGDSNLLHLESRLEAFQRYAELVQDERYANIDPAIHQEAHKHGHRSIEIIAWVMNDAGFTPDIDLEAAAPIWNLKTELYAQRASQGIPAIPGALDFIYQTNAIWPNRQGIVTSAYREREVLPFLGRHGLWQYFPDDHIITADDFTLANGKPDTARQKPAPDQYEELMDRFKIYDPAELLVFEDNSRGICSAKAAGARVIAMAHTHSVEEIRQFSPEAQPDAIAEDFDEVYQLIGL